MPLPSTMTPIATNTLGSATTTVTFSSIPSNYTDLVLVIAGSTSANDGLLRFNGDTTGANYSSLRLYGTGSSAVSDRPAEQGLTIGGFTNGVSIVNIMNYKNTTTYKTSISRINNPGGYVDASVLLWLSTAAINQVTAYAQSNWAVGCTFTLYGIMAA